MKHRIYTRVPLDGRNALTGDERQHAARVAGVCESEEAELFDGDGHAASGVVESIGGDELIVRVDHAIDARESPFAIDLAMAIIQLEKFELVLQKATELGVRSIVPMITEHVEIRSERYRGKHDRWEKIIFEAVKQSGRATLPKLEEPMQFEDVLKREGTKILFDADTPPRQLSNPATQATLLIGPEGGWTEQELALARPRSS